MDSLVGDSKFESEMKGYIDSYIEEELGCHFPRLLDFIKQSEPLFDNGDTGVPALDEVCVVVVCNTQICMFIYMCVFLFYFLCICIYIIYRLC